MVQDPQHVLREPDGTVRGYIFADSNNDIVIEHAGSGEQAVLGSSGLDASGIADDPHDNAAHSETYATESYADDSGGVTDHSELTGVGANDHHTPPSSTDNTEMSGGYTDLTGIEEYNDDTSYTIHIGQYTDEVGIRYDAHDSNYINVVIYDTQGNEITSDTWNIDDTNNNFETISTTITPQTVGELSIYVGQDFNGSVSAIVQIHSYPVPSHNHSI